MQRGRLRLSPRRLLPHGRQGVGSRWWVVGPYSPPPAPYYRLSPHTGVVNEDWHHLLPDIRRLWSRGHRTRTGTGPAGSRGALHLLRFSVSPAGLRRGRVLPRGGYQGGQVSIVRALPVHAGARLQAIRGGEAGESGPAPRALRDPPRDDRLPGEGDAERGALAQVHNHPAWH